MTMKRKKGYSSGNGAGSKPACVRFAAVGGAGAGWQAFSALQLASFADWRLGAGMGSRQPGSASDLPARLARFLYALHDGPHNAGVTLQYRFQPPPGRDGVSQVSCTLFIRAAGTEADACAQACMEQAGHTLMLAEDLLPEYEWQPALAAREVDALWQAGYMGGHCCEMVRQPFALRLDSGHPTAIGFQGAAGGRAGGLVQQGRAVPLVPRESARPASPPNLLLNALSRQHLPLVLSISLTPACLTGEEQEALWKQISICEGFPAFSSSAGRAQQRMADLARDHLLEAYLRLQERPFEVQAWLCSDQPVPGHLALLAASQLFGVFTSMDDPLPPKVEVIRSFTASPSGGCGPEDWALPVPGGEAPGREPLVRIPRLFAPDEAASLFLLPQGGDAGLPGIRLRRERSVPLVIESAEGEPAGGTALGVNIYQGICRPVQLTPQERAQHMYVVGKSGTGKTTLLKQMALSDIRAGHGVAVFDPHGDLFTDLLALIPDDRWQDVVILDPSDMEYPVGLNLLECRNEAERYAIAREMKAVMRRILNDMFQKHSADYTGPVFYNHMQMNLLLTMSDLQDPGTLLQFYEIFQRDGFWQRWMPLKWKDSLLETWVEGVLPRTSYTLRRNYSDPSLGEYINSKFTDFVFDPRLRLIFGQPSSTLSFSRIMDEGKILLVNLSKGLLGEANAQFLGLVLMAKLNAELMGRAALPPDRRRPFYLYVDEFQSLATENFSIMMSEARKFGLSMVLANQYLSQVQDSAIMQAIFGNVGIMVAFRVGQEDAERLQAHFQPSFGAYDLINLPNYHACVRNAARDGFGSLFSLQTVLPGDQPDERSREIMLAYSRARYGRPREQVEAMIRASLAYEEEEREETSIEKWAKELS